jgi:hypothetical protein
MDRRWSAPFKLPWKCIVKITRMWPVAVLVASSLLSSLAVAAEVSPPAPRPLPAPRSRAEVRAELQVYRESGLADLERVPEFTDFNSPQYLRAKDRYEQLHESPYFQALVQSYSEGRDPTRIAGH